MPAAVLIRAARPDEAPAIARVHMESRLTTYRGLVPEATLAEKTLEDRTASWARFLADAEYGRAKFLLVAEAGREVVGFASAEPERTGDPAHAGEVSSIYLLEPFQRRGIGGALVREAFAALAGTGRRSALIWVLATNPARAFYEALGGTLTGHRKLDRAGGTLEHVAYGWPDVLAGAGPRERAVWDLWTAISRRDWSGARALLAADFAARWPNTGETLDRDAFIRVNEVYPGDWRIRVVRVAPCGEDEVVSVVEVCNGDTRVFATSFFGFAAGGIASATEYWSDCAPPPDWRRTP